MRRGAAEGTRGDDAGIRRGGQPQGETDAQRESRIEARKQEQKKEEAEARALYAERGQPLQDQQAAAAAQSLKNDRAAAGMALAKRWVVHGGGLKEQTPAGAQPPGPGSGFSSGLGGWVATAEKDAYRPAQGGGYVSGAAATGDPAALTASAAENLFFEEERKKAARLVPQLDDSPLKKSLLMAFNAQGADDMEKASVAVSNAVQLKLAAQGAAQRAEAAEDG